MQSSLLRRVAKIVIAEGFTKALCPGEERCVKFASAVDKDDACLKCDKNLAKQKLSDVEYAQVVMPWVGHLLYLYGMKQIGVAFRVNDLTKDEWDGLIMIEGLKNEIEKERLEKDELKRKVAAASGGSHKGRGRR